MGIAREFYQKSRWPKNGFIADSCWERIRIRADSSILPETSDLYYLIRIWVRAALYFFCKRIREGNAGMLRTKGPLLLVANHPNSFLDAIIIGSRFDRPVHFLARGDAFRKPLVSKLLATLNMIPVYRLSEGKENLLLNEQAFRRSREILSAGGIVLIFIEGICVHSHELQPFKKGAARIAFENRALKNFCVLPLGIAYDDLWCFGKTIQINYGETLVPEQLFSEENEAKNLIRFNGIMLEKIQPLIQIPAEEKTDAILRGALWYPAWIGRALHAPLWIPLQRLILSKTKGTVFYDSVLFASFMLLYPLYLLFVFFVLLWVGKEWATASLFIMPLTAKAGQYLRTK
jgi:1-acyl-sn-glycerol-3-phosphate acyltransferase